MMLINVERVVRVIAASLMERPVLKERPRHSFGIMLLRGARGSDAFTQLFEVNVIHFRAWPGVHTLDHQRAELHTIREVVRPGHIPGCHKTTLAQLTKFTGGRGAGLSVGRRRGGAVRGSVGR